MAGAKGRSGGARRGAGRKPKQPAYVTPETAKVEPGEPLDPRPTLELVALGHMEVSAQQMKALVALLPYVHGKKGAAASKPAPPAQVEPSPYGVRRGPQLATQGGRRV